MTTKANVVRTYVTWDALPLLAVGDVLTKPVDPIRNEDLKNAYQYSESDLRAFASNHLDLTYGGKLRAAALTELPDGFLLNSYLNLRYGIVLPDGIMPIRAGANFSTSYPTLAIYPLMAAVIAGIYETVASSVNPTTQAEAVQLFRLQRQLCYSWIVAANRHRAAPTEKNNPIQGGQTITKVLGDVVETERVVIIDYTAAQPLLAIGWTPQTLANYWVSKNLQPR